VSQDLRIDARRDLNDIGAGYIPIYGDDGGDQVPQYDFQGVVFITYGLLRYGLPKQEKRSFTGAQDSGGEGSSGSADARKEGFKFRSVVHVLTLSFLHSVLYVAVW